MDVATLGITIENGQAISAVNALGGSLEGLAARGASVIAKMAGITAAIGASTVTLMKAVSDAQQFEKQMALVATVTDTTTISMNRLSREALTTFRNLPVQSLNDVTKGLYDIISAGIPAGDAMKYLNTAARAAVAGVTSTATAVDALTTATNAWRGNNLTATQAADAMFMAVNKGKMTFEQLASSIGTIAPIAAAYKIKIEDVLGASAQLTLSGLTASEAMVGIRSAISNILTPTQKLKEAFPQLAEQFNAAKLQAVGFTKFLLEFNQATGGSKEALNALFTDVQGKTAVFSLLADGGKALAEQVRNVEGAAGSMSKAFDTATETSSALNQRLKNELAATFVQLGTQLLPVVNTGLSAMISVLHGVQQIGQFRAELETLALAIGLAGVAGAIIKVLPLIKEFLFITGIGPAFAAAEIAGTGFAGALYAIGWHLRNIIAARVEALLFFTSIGPAFAAANVAGTGFTGAIYSLALHMRNVISSGFTTFLLAIGPTFTAATLTGTGFAGVLTVIGANAARMWAALLGPVGIAAAAIAVIIALFYKWRKGVEEAKVADELKEENDQRAYEAAMGRVRARKQAQEQEVENTKQVQKAVNATLVERAAEIEKQRAINDAHGQGALAIQLLVNKYDAMIEKARFVEGHTSDQIKQYNKQTDSLNALKDAAARYAAQQQALSSVEQARAAAATDTITKVDDMSAALIAQQRALDDTRKDLVALNDPKLLATFDEYRDRVLNNQRALLGLQPTLEAAEKLTKQLGVTTLDAVKGLPDVSRQYDQMAASLVVVIKNTKEGTEAHEAAKRALDELNKARADAIDRTIQEAKAIGQAKDAMNADAAKRIADERKRSEDAAAAFKEPFKNAIEAVQQDFKTMFENMLTSGVDSFSNFASQIKSVFIKLIADLAAMQFTKKILSASPALASMFGIQSSGGGGTTMGIDNSLFSPEMLAKLKGPPGAGTQALGYAGIGLGTFGLGYGLGQSMPSGGLGAAAGAVAGGATGAALGTMILPGIGTAIGAAVGALAGLVGGLLGSASAAKERKKVEEQLRDAYTESVAQIKVQLGLLSPLDQALTDNAQAFKKLRAAVEEAYSGRGNEAERESKLRELAKLEAMRAEQLKKENEQLKEIALQQAQVRILRAQGLTREAEDLARKLAYDKEIADAVKQFGANSEQVTAVIAAQAEEMKALARARDEANQKAQEDLEVRRLRALGLDDEADALQLALQQQREYNEALKQGFDDATLAALREVQALEKERIEKEKATAAAERAAQSFASLSSAFLRLTGRGGQADWLDLLERQRQQTKSSESDTPANRALLGVVQLFERGQFVAQQRITEQTNILKNQLKAQQDQLQVAQSQLQTLRAAENSLRQFRTSLDSGGLSALNPLDQLAASKANVERLFRLAKGGDANAAQEFGGAASTYLQLARDAYASTEMYADIYNTIVSMADDLAGQYGHQASLQQQVVDALQDQIKLLQQQIDELQDANRLADETKRAVIEELERVRDDALGVNGPLLDQFNMLADTLTGVGQQIAGDERDILLSNHNGLIAITQAEIDAINRGASAEQITALDQVRLLQLQKTSVDDGFAKQIVEMGSKFGFDSPIVKELLNQQTSYDQGVNEQINAILSAAGLVVTGVGGSVGGAIRSIGDMISRLPISRPTDPPATGGGGLPGGGGSNPITPRRPGLLYTIAIDHMDGPGRFIDQYGVSHTDMSEVGTMGRLARGGDFAGGLAMVGEHAPELIATGAARVHTAEQINAAVVKAVEKLGDRLEKKFNDLRDSVDGQTRSQRQSAAAIREMA